MTRDRLSFLNDLVEQFIRKDKNATIADYFDALKEIDQILPGSNREVITEILMTKHRNNSAPAE